MKSLTAVYLAVAVGIAGLSLIRGRRRLLLSRAKHSSLVGHVRMGKRIAAMIPFYEYDENRFFQADNAPPEVAGRRRAGFQRLIESNQTRSPKTLALTRDTLQGLSDLQFTATYRVPFQFSRMMRENLPVGAFIESSSGVTVTDPDGNSYYDLSGSYGVNLFGLDFYKRCIRDGAKAVDALGPALGLYHPIVADNVRRLREISGHDEVSFHMSGTEAVMQAVRLARYHTRKSHLVRFAGAYHGWWGDVQPGIGNPVPADRTYTLAEMSDRALRVIATRSNIACVLVNPLQVLHPNGSAPSDSTLVGGRNGGRFDRTAYSDWLRRLSAVCREANVPLIMDDVFLGFRLAPGGASGYFGIQPDLVTYGKTLGGGLPVGVLCGRAELMKRFRPERPVDVCFARGTFNSHPYVMGTMNTFLRSLDQPDVRAVYDNLDETWNGRADRLNQRLAEAGAPVSVSNLSSIWTVNYTAASRYNWMFQYYLRAEGLSLSWVGTGRLIFSLNYSEADFQAVAYRFVAAARAMHADGWWWVPEGQTNKKIRRTILAEAFSKRLRGRVPLRRCAGAPAIAR